MGNLGTSVRRSNAVQPNLCCTLTLTSGYQDNVTAMMSRVKRCTVQRTNPAGVTMFTMLHTGLVGYSSFTIAVTLRHRKLAARYQSRVPHQEGFMLAFNPSLLRDGRRDNLECSILA